LCESSVGQHFNDSQPLLFEVIRQRIDERGCAALCSTPPLRPCCARTRAFDRPRKIGQRRKLLNHVLCGEQVVGRAPKELGTTIRELHRYPVSPAKFHIAEDGLCDVERPRNVTLSQTA
jgi:hypothetical protein